VSQRAEPLERDDHLRGAECTQHFLTQVLEVAADLRFAAEELDHRLDREPDRHLLDEVRLVANAVGVTISSISDFRRGSKSRTRAR